MFILDDFFKVPGSPQVITLHCGIHNDFKEGRILLSFSFEFSMTSIYSLNDLFVAYFLPILRPTGRFIFYFLDLFCI